MKINIELSDEELSDLTCVLHNLNEVLNKGDVTLEELHSFYKGDAKFLALAKKIEKYAHTADDNCEDFSEMSLKI
jgi:hypothetical protein